MEIINNIDIKLKKATAITIGKFDGLHIGHQRLLMHTEQYRKRGYKPVVFSIDMKSNHVIYTQREKEIILGQYNMDTLIECPFDELSGMTAEEFFVEILINRLNVKAIVVGKDFRFGYQRSGTVETLEHLADKYSVRVDVIEKEVIGDKEISSSYIRDKIIDGDLDCANSLLGRPYIIHGEVLHGRKIGRTLGMPTVNLEVEDNKILPPKGVYASRVIYNGIRYNAVTNIGVKPTIEGDSKLGIESFMFDFNQEIYGENVTVEILSYQRPEQKFSDMDMLKKQMHTDREEANYRIRRYSNVI